MSTHMSTAHVYSTCPHTYLHTCLRACPHICPHTCLQAKKIVMAYRRRLVMSKWRTVSVRQQIAADRARFFLIPSEHADGETPRAGVDRRGERRRASVETFFPTRRSHPIVGPLGVRRRHAAEKSPKIERSRRFPSASAIAPLSVRRRRALRKKI